MRSEIPAPVVAALSEILADAETHAGLNNLFMHAGAPGDPPEGNKRVKVQEWIRRVNRDQSVTPLEILGRLIEPHMEADFLMPPEGPFRAERKARIEKALARCGLHYASGGVIAGALGPASKSLDDLIRGRNVSVLDEEFARALRNVESNPREAVSAGCNILESACKVYIQDERLETPAKQDLQGVWGVVRKDLGFDPGTVEDRDLQAILSSLIGVVSGIGAFRTHASSAHGAGRTSFVLEPHHARLAVHAAHSVVAFLLESWDQKKRNAPKNNAV
jgi:abortive infection Abi-like protein